MPWTQLKRGCGAWLICRAICRVCSAHVQTHGHYTVRHAHLPLRSQSCALRHCQHLAYTRCWPPCCRRLLLLALRRVAFVSSGLYPSIPSPSLLNGTVLSNDPGALQSWSLSLSLSVSLILTPSWWARPKLRLVGCALAVHLQHICQVLAGLAVCICQSRKLAEQWLTSICFASYVYPSRSVIVLFLDHCDRRTCTEHATLLGTVQPQPCLPAPLWVYNREPISPY